MRTLLKIFFLSCLAFTANGQRSANWYFGQNAAVKFTQTGPVAIAGSQMVTQEGCSSMSDVNGNLLFYTDGQTVWNKNNAVMINGTGLRGGNSSAQSSIIIPAVGNSNQYYIFTATQAGDIFRKYCYNIVDMTLQGGLGEVVQKNIEFDDNCSERITAANHANGTDFWIITNNLNSNTFKAFLLTSTGLSTTPVISNVGPSINSIVGMCKVSPDGNWLVQTITSVVFGVTAQLFNFNASSGIISNRIGISLPANLSYGCAFSPNSNRLYISYLTNIFQLTLNSAQETIINNSRATISTGGGIGDLSLGPDQKIYVARLNSTRVSRLNNPDDSAANVGFVDTAVILANSTFSRLGLPNFYNNINIPPNIAIKVDTLSCLQFRFSFNSTTSYNYQGIFKWDFGDGSLISNDSIATHTYTRTNTDSFLVKFNFRSPDNTVDLNFQRWLVLPKKPLANFTAPTLGCIKDSLRIINNASSTNGLITQYNWWLGDGSTSNSFAPIKKYTDTGTYTIKLLVKDTLGCISDTGRLTVKLNKKSIANFGIEGPYCKDVALQLKDSSKVFNSNISNWWYGWNNGNTYSSSTNGNFLPTFTAEGNYTIKAVVNTPEGCISDTTTKNYFVYNRPIASFILPQNCVADISNFIGTSSIIGASTINYWKWDFGITSTLSDTARTANASYQYNIAAQYPVQLWVMSNQGCRDSVLQNFRVNGALPKAKIAFVQNPICGRDSVVLVNQSTVDFGTLTRINLIWGPSSFTENNPLPNNRYTYKYPEFGTPANIVQPIKITVNSGVNCVNQLDTFIVLKAQPRVQFSLPDAVCWNNLPINLNQGIETNGAIGTFAYSGLGVSNSSTNQFVFTPKVITPSTTAKIQYTFATPAGCSDSAIRSIKILPSPIANAGPDRIVLEGGQVTLLATASGNGLSFAWQPAQLVDNPTKLQPLAMVNNDARLQLTVTNDMGCVDSSSTNLKILRFVSPPNAFSPNGDRINETWVIPNLDTYPNCNVSIFNRQGQQVFFSKGYKNAWDGTYNGKPLPVATYYYIIEPGSGRNRISGWVQIIR